MDNVKTDLLKNGFNIKTDLLFKKTDLLCIIITIIFCVD